MGASALRSVSADQSFGHSYTPVGGSRPTRGFEDHALCIVGNVLELMLEREVFRTPKPGVSYGDMLAAGDAIG